MKKFHYSLLFGIFLLLPFASANASLNILTEVTDFGSNPGSLKMYKYVPANVKSPAPLMVPLHGCTQNAEMYNDENGWTDLADRYGFILMFPETNTINQMRGCFTWYEPADYERGQGEALSMYNMVQKMKQDYSIDDSQVYLSGLSAGATMAANLLATYPDVYKGASIQAGSPYRSATTLLEGMNIYNGTLYGKTPQQWGDLYRARFADINYTGPKPRVSIVMGDADHRYNPQYAFELVEAFTNLHGQDQTPDAGTPYDFRRSQHYTYSIDGGEPYLELWHMNDMIHVQTVDPCEEPDPSLCAPDKGGRLYASDTGTRFEHTEDWDLWASYYSAKFLGLVTEDTLEISIDSPADGATVYGTITVQTTVDAGQNTVDQVAFYLNENTTATCIDNSEPYECEINTISLADGNTTIKAVASTASDSAEASITVDVDNIDDIAPVITLIGNAEMSVLVNGTFTDPGANASDDRDGDISSQITVTGSVDTATAGTYTLTYNVSDAAGNAADPVIRTVTVEADTTAPVITLTGSATVTIYVGDSYTDAGATAQDNIDGDLTSQITVTGSVNTAAVGTYTLEYDVSDAAGNTADTVTRTVNVIADTVAPVITLLGSATITIDLNSSFTDPGATASDNKDGDLTAQIVVDGNVNTSAAGTYTLTYNVSDAAGNAAAEATRTVIVNDAPVCADYTATNSQHESAGRAYSQSETTGQTCWGSWCWGGTTTTTWYATGSNENLGTSGSTTVTLKEQPIGSGSFSVGECPSEPQPPVLVSYDVSSLGYYSAVITGTATDADGDLDHVVLGLGAVTGFVCEGTSSFTCTLNFDDYGFAAGAQISLTVTVFDAQGQTDTSDIFLVTRPGNAAPVINNVSHNVSGGVNMLVTGSASDVDNDISSVHLRYTDMVGNLDCSGTTSFTCDLQGHPVGTYNFKVVVYDAYGNETESDPFTVEFTEYTGEAPVISNVSHSVNGLGIYVTADVTDVDGDLDEVRVIVTSEIGAFDCTNTGGASFSCVADPVSPRTYTMKVVAIDVAGNMAESAEFTVTVVEAPTCVTATNSAHTSAGRAYQMYNIIYYAEGSANYLGLSSTTTSLEETSPGYWEKVSSCN